MILKKIMHSSLSKLFKELQNDIENRLLKKSLAYLYVNVIFVPWPWTNFLYDVCVFFFFLI